MLSLQDEGVLATTSRYVNPTGAKPAHCWSITNDSYLLSIHFFFNITAAIYLLSTCTLGCYYIDCTSHVVFILKVFKSKTTQIYTKLKNRDKKIEVR